MKKLLIIALLVVGCQDVGVMKHTHDDYADEVRTLQVIVEEKMYTERNNFGVTVYYDDDDTDHNTVVIFASWLTNTGVWTNIESFNGVYYEATIYVGGINEDYDEPLETGYDDKYGYSALFRDPDKFLLGKELKLNYIP